MARPKKLILEDDENTGESMEKDVAEILAKDKTEESLKNDERETIINYNQGEDTAYIYTHHKALQRHLEKTLKLKPTEVNSHKGKSYELPKKWLRLPRMTRKKELTDEQRQALSDRMTKSHASGKLKRGKQPQESILRSGDKQLHNKPKGKKAGVPKR